MQKTGRLELTWVGKYEDKVVEPRILLEDTSKSYGDPSSENMLIHGDNLIALQALQQDFSGEIKCIYIDPPYNTRSAFEHYDDNLEHSIWLSLMRERLILLRELLSEEGTIWIQIDDEEQAYLKVLCDEVFGRGNFVNMISVNMKNIAGASGGGHSFRRARPSHSRRPHRRHSEGGGPAGSGGSALCAPDRSAGQGSSKGA